MTQTTYFVQAKKNDEVEILAHGKDKETGELWTDFFDKKKARELLEAEKKISPEYQYRIVKRTSTYKIGIWE